MFDNKCLVLQEFINFYFDLKCACLQYKYSIVIFLVTHFIGLLYF